MKRIFITASIFLLMLCMIIPLNAASNGTVARGDTASFNLTLGSAVTGVGSGSVSVNYDSSYLEIVSGSFNVSNAFLTNFDVSKGKGAFAFSGAETVSGSIFSITFRVKDTAPFGTTTLSVALTLKDGSNVSITEDNLNASVTVKCNHSYTKQDTTYLASSATCTSPAKYYYSCESCGEKGTTTFTYGSPSTHSFTKQTVTNTYKKSDATCTAKAVYYYCCTTCSAKGTDTYEYGSVASHSYTKKVTTDAYKISGADCENPALYYFCCATCDQKGSNTYSYGSALGHTGGSASCTKKAICTRCKNEYGEKLNHTYDKEVVSDTYLASTATCTTLAKYYKSCSCGEKGTTTFEYGSTVSHSYTRKNVTDVYKKSNATCTAKAVYYYCCTTCSAKGTDTYEYGSVASHSYTKKVTTDAYKISGADCENPALYYFCCATCDQKGSNTFSYGSALGHTGGSASCTKKAICTRCKNEYGEKLSHTYNKEVVSDTYLASTATCTTLAKYYKSCTCGEKGTTTFEHGKKTEHKYIEKVSNAYLKSAASCTQKAIYYKSCSLCGTQGTEIFETGATPSHSYNSAWSSDSSSHWHECSKCGDMHSIASHVPGAAATETTAQKCTVCSYVITPALGHTHNYNKQWSYDAHNHWYACSGCSDSKEKGAHVFDNACDQDCNTCGYIRTITHNYNSEWKTDTTNHWHECSICKATENFESHIPETNATETTQQTCTVCGCVIKSAIEHTHNYTTEWVKDEVNHWHECTCGEKSEEFAHSWDDGVISKEATRKEEGEKFFTCLDCAQTKTEKIDKLTDNVSSSDQDTDTNDSTATEPMNTSSSETTTAHQESEKNPDDKKDELGIKIDKTPIIAISIVAVVALGGVVALIISKKKK